MRCRAAGIAEVIAGPRGVVLVPRPNLRLDPAAIARANEIASTQLKRDGQLAIKTATRDATQRLALVGKLIELMRPRPVAEHR